MTRRSLHLAEDLTIPLDAVSRTFGILAVRGAGKSNTAAVMAEEMFAAGLPFVVVDPVGSWFGLRSSADGKQPGLPIPIFGGKHGDVPLERGAGELLADLVVEKRLTCVLDLSRFESEGAKKSFLLAFAQRLYLKNENPLHLFLEEADDYIPQKPMRDEAQLLRAWENIVRRGRARGLGMTIITQRSAAVNKMVLTQVETLFAMRTTGPQDIAAIEAWVKYHQAGQEVLSTLASLDDGEAWVWSPHFLKTMSRHQIRRRHTFDSGATPANIRAKDTRPPATLADIDLSALQERMAATIEKAKADDPRELRKQIAELKKTIGRGDHGTVTTQLHRVDVLTDADRELLKAVHSRLGGMGSELGAASGVFIAEFEQHIEKVIQGVMVKMHERAAHVHETKRREFERGLEAKGFQKILGKLASVAPAPNGHTPTTTTAVPRSPLARRVAPAPATSRPARQVSTDAGTLPAGERTILTAVAQYPDGPDRSQLSLLSGYKRSTRDRYVQFLQQKGLVEVRGDRIVATPDGLAVLGDFEPLPTGDELRSYWLNKLPEGEAVVLAAIVRGWPNAVAREQIDRETNYKRSTRDRYIQFLQARKLVTADRDGVLASKELFS